MNPVVLGGGEVELLTERGDLERFRSIMNEKYATDYGLDMVDPNANCSFRMQPTWVFGLRSDEFTGSPTRWVFER